MACSPLRPRAGRIPALCAPPLVWLFAALLACCLCAPGALAQPRQPILAGTWYPADPAALRQSVEGHIQEAQATPLPGELVGLIAPHAGHVYSGAIAGHAYAALSRQPADTVVVIAPSHRHYFHGVSVHDSGGYATPLGVMELDEAFIAELRRQLPSLTHVPKAHAEEHSLEIQIPFLQVAAPKARLVPLVMGQQDLDICHRLAEALSSAVSRAAGKRVVLLASSDLSHYHDAATCAQLDGRIHDAVRAMDPRAMAACLGERTCEACGAGPMITVMLASRDLGANKGLVLATGDSGQVSGDKDKVVGYMAAAFVHARGGAARRSHGRQPIIRLASHAAIDDGDAGGGNADYSPRERELLHSIAREAIASGLEGRPYSLPIALPQSLQQERGAFVTLKRQGRLRGCTGHVIGSSPLAQTVAEMARLAAFEDPRFPPLQASELADLEYEISVLTPPRQVQDVAEIEVGRHGLIMRGSQGQGLLLPQVATEYGWNREQFLQNTCRKAGMATDCWQQPDTRIYVFSAEVF